MLIRYSILNQCVIEDYQLLFVLLTNIQGGPKNGTVCVERLNFCQILTDFQNSFTVRIGKKFVIALSLKDPATLQVCR